MPQLAFGSSIATATQILSSGVAQPRQFMVNQETQINLSGTNKELKGMNQVAEAVARGEIKIEGTVKVGKVYGGIFNDLFHGQSGSQGPVAGQTLMVFNELVAVPATTPYTVVCAQGAHYKEDLGVFYYTTGAPLTKVASSETPTAGQYTLDTSTGTYTFAAADEGLSMYLNYSYSVTTGYTLTVYNQLQGVQPVFALTLFAADPKKTGQMFGMKLFNCIATKMSFPFKQGDWMISDMGFQAFADDSGRVLEYYYA